ncbi:hypothetical protein CGI54_24530, partial [Vibrio parahaemolyticus]
LIAWHNKILIYMKYVYKITFASCRGKRTGRNYPDILAKQFVRMFLVLCTVFFGIRSQLGMVYSLVVTWLKSCCTKKRWAGM